MSAGITKTFLFSCIILLLNFIISHSILFNGLEYREMYSNDAVFIADTAYWGISNQVAALKYTDCGGTYILGGYNVLGTTSTGYLSYFQRYYTGLPAHNMIRFTLNFYAIDTWDAGKDGFYFYFDAREIDNFWHLSAGSFPAQVCGASYADLTNMRIFGILKHTSSVLDFRMVSTLDSMPSDESWGLRNWNILFDKNPVVSENICARASIALPASTCTCSEGYYYDGSTCQLCHANCASCYGAAASQCYQCKQTGGYSFDGFQCIACSTRCDTCFGTAANQCTTCLSGYTYYPANYQCLAACPYPLNIISGQCYSPCATITDYIYWDKSCASTCPSPFQSTTIPTIPTLKLCIFPCSAQDFLYWDGSCRPDCSSPLIQTVNRNIRTCTSPCTLSQYVYPDGSCYSVCNLPLLKKFYKDQNFCVSPCNVPGQYLYANGECVSSCVNPPFTPTTIMGIDYCIYPCVGTSNYLYWNGSCYSECKFPNLVRITHNEQYCDYPTNTANWLYWDGTEHTTCNLPLLQRIETVPNRNYCDFKCMIYEYLYWNGTCSTECIFPLSKRLSNGRRFCDYPCSGTDTLYWNGSCLPSSTCNLPLLTRNDLGTLYCEFPDGDITQYLYWDGTFASTCDYPLFARIEGSPMVRKFCDFICNSPTPYLYWDQTCGASCLPSTAITETITGGKLMCIFPCRDLFLLFNGSCVETCDLPFTQVIQGIGKYCNHPCASTSNNHYYYWNGACKPVCNPPLQKYTTDGTLIWCIYPCEGSMSLYTNGTCAEGCNAPFRKHIGLDGMNYCVNPCLSTEYYVTWNQTCSSSCPYPYVIESTNMGTLCQLPCSEDFEFLDQDTGECITECDRDSTKVDDAYMLCLTDPTDYSSALDILLESSSGGSRHTLVTLNKMLQYVRYLDIKMPPRLRHLAYNQDSLILSLRFPAKMSADLQEHFIMNSIPEVYEKYGLHSNFLVNFWQEICNWIVFAILGLIFTALEAFCKNASWSTLERFFEKLRIITKWNLLLVLLGTSVNDIVLFGVLHLRSLKLNSPLAGLSFEVCLLAVCILNILIFATYYFVKQQKRNLAFQSQVRYFEFLKTYNGYQVLYQGFRQNNPLNRGFYLVYIIRFLLPSLVASVLWFSPVAQTVFYILISLVILPYIWIARPMRRKLDHVQLVILESFVLVINCCLFGLVICSNMSKSSSYSAIMMADIVVGLNSGITILFIVVLILKILQGIKILRKSHKAQQQEIFSKIDRTEWLQLLVYFLQQGGMGFETIYVNPEGGFKAEIYHEMEEAVKEIRKKDKIEELKREVSSLRALAEETKALKTPKPRAKTEIMPDLAHTQPPTQPPTHRIGGRFSQPQSVQKPSTAITDITRGLSHDEFSNYGVEVAERPDTGNNLHAESTLIPMNHQSQWNEVPGGTLSHLGSRRDSALFFD